MVPALRDGMAAAAAARYRRTQGHEVWMVLKYVRERNVSRRRVSSWLNYTKSDQYSGSVMCESVAIRGLVLVGSWTVSYV